MRCALFLRPTAAMAVATRLGSCASVAQPRHYTTSLTTTAASAAAQYHHKGCLQFARRAASNASAPSTDSTNPSTASHVVHYSKLGMDGFTDVKYNTAADDFLENVEAKLDALDAPELEDVNCNSGVLTIETASKGTFILNKQAPNVQLWLSSPVSGPHHYDMVTSTKDGMERVYWRSDSDEHDLQEKLESELSDVLGQPFQL